MLDNTRLRSELTHIHRTLSSIAVGPRGGGLADHFRREIDGTPAAVIWQSLYADCLRVAYTAAAADGVIGDDEITALSELIFAVARHYADLLPAYRDFAGTDPASIRAFLTRYATDGGSFGERARLHWPGLTLCRRAADLGEAEPLERYERLMSWLIPAACEIGGVTESDPRWGGRVAELHGLRRTLASTAAKATPPAVDLRLQAFLTPTGVFAAVQQAVSVFDSDPFDVETVHQSARTSFEQLVERATNPSQHSERGRMLLLLGDSGAGKTHLLRGFRRHIHELGRGLVVYAQMNSAADDYIRYMLQHVVDSLARSHVGPSGAPTGLFELASGLARLVEEPLRSEILKLAEGDWNPKETLRDVVNRLVDELLKVPALGRFETDLLRVLLYSLAPDERTTAHAYRYLRCEDMNPHDRRWLGDVVPRTRGEHPSQMIRDLARLAFVTRGAAMVLMVDQAELAGHDPLEAGKMFRRALDALYSVVSEVSSAVAVVACLTDVYQSVRWVLGSSMTDRLESDPPSEYLQSNRSYPEIEAIVGRRLEWLFAQAKVAYRAEDPVYPIPPAALRNLTNRRTRDVLQWCHQFHSRCVSAKKIVDVADGGIATPLPDETDLNQIAASWNDACHASGIEVPETAEAILLAIGAAAKACTDELGISLTVPPRNKDVLRLMFEGPGQRAELAIAVTNHGYQRGAFGVQIEALRKSAHDATPVAVRTLEFPRGRACNEAVGKLLKSGGRRAYLDGSTLRTLAAFQKFQPAFPEARVAAWRRRDRPISTLPPMADLFDLERLRGSPAIPVVTDAPVHATATPPTGVPVVTTPAESSVVRRVAKTPVMGVSVVSSEPASGADSTTTNDDMAKRAVNGQRGRPPGTGKLNGKPAAPKLSSQLDVGTAPTFSAEPRTIEIGSLLRHTGILGSSGSGKTTLALNLIEQVLERDVAVVLVDRKGDLAGYAKPQWWQHTADPERARRLAERIDVRLFTPGTRGGRPLSLSAVPDLQHIPEHDRDRMVQYAANALAAMMHLGKGANDSACRAILTQAIAVLAERNRPCGLPELIDLLEQRDDHLLARAGRYDDKLFKRLVQDLETVRLHNEALFDPAGEPLTAETLIGRAADDKVPLAIVSTKFLGDVEQVQSWVAHLIACLNRYAAKAPSAELRAIFMIDEADVFMPAGASKPPSKEPLQDLLKRARAAGLGIVLASQSPADFDYRSREQISTWFLGRIADQRSIDKMEPLFEHKPAVGGKLGTQDPGRFVLLQDGAAVDLGRTPSMLRTEQLPEAELMVLAAGARHRV
jgi:energy-coupling factor transporter ATP-binding protein EcfA2